MLDLLFNGEIERLLLFLFVRTKAEIMSGISSSSYLVKNLKRTIFISEPNLTRKPHKGDRRDIEFSKMETLIIHGVLQNGDS